MANIQDDFERRAGSGDGYFAIAAAILRLADAQQRTADAVNKLGVNNASTDMGAIEVLSTGVAKIAEAIERVAGSLGPLEHLKSED
jgi:hypothetical protein